MKDTGSPVVYENRGVSFGIVIRRGAWQRRAVGDAGIEGDSGG